MTVDTTHSSPNRSSRRGTVVDSIILHATAGDSYSGAISWLCSRKSGVSAHYVIGRAGEIAKLVPTSMCAWHAGRARHPADGRQNVNLRSIGIELVNLNDGRMPYPQAQRDALYWLIGEIYGAFYRGMYFGSDIKYLYSHAAVAIPRGRKTDPKGLEVPALAAEFELEG